MRTLLSGLDAAGAQTLDGRRGGDGNRRGLFEREVRRLAGELVLAGRGVLGEGAAADAEHLVADREPGHRRADRLDRAGDGQTGHAVLRCTEAEAHDAHQVRAAGHRVPRTTVEPRSLHSHQHLVGLDLGPVDVGQVPRLARAVGVLRDRSHRIGRLSSGRHVSVVSGCCRGGHGSNRWICVDDDVGSVELDVVARVVDRHEPGRRRERRPVLLASVPHLVQPGFLASRRDRGTGVGPP